MPRTNKSELAWREIQATEENPYSYGYLPINLTLPELKAIFDKHYRGKRKYSLQRALSCLSTIVIVRYNVPHEERKGAWYMGYTNVSSRTFIKWVGSDYSDYLNTLIRAKIIETDNCYIVGEKSKGYKFGAYYTAPDCSDTENEWRKTYKVQYTDIKLLVRGYEARKLRLQNTSLSTGRTRLNEMGAELSKCVDIARAEADFNALSAEHGRNFCIGKISLDEAFFHLDRILSGAGSLYNEKDEFGFRFHTPYTNLPSLLRRYIIINGKESEEVDFKNSNAFYFANIAKHPKSVLSLMGTDINAAAVKTISNYYKAGSTDFTRFVDEALAGTLYEYLEDTVKLHGKSINRATAKSLVMKFMNSDSSQYVNLKAEVAKVLPNVVRLCSTLNVNGRKTIPRLLQRLEATVVIDKIAVPLTTETKYSFTTVHDSLLCSVEDAELIVDKIRTVHAALGLAVPEISYKR